MSEGYELGSGVLLGLFPGPEPRIQNYICMYPTSILNKGMKEE